MSEIRLAIAGVGNCASALLQGLEYYRTHDPAESAGVLHPRSAAIASRTCTRWRPSTSTPARWAARSQEAAFAAPNCTAVFQEKLPAWA